MELTVNNVQVKALAQSMGVSEYDVIAFANGVVNDMMKDDVASDFVRKFQNGNESQFDILDEYTVKQANKFSEFYLLYKLDKLEGNIFLKNVFDLLKQG